MVSILFQASCREKSQPEIVDDTLPIGRIESLLEQYGTFKGKKRPLTYEEVRKYLEFENEEASFKKLTWDSLEISDYSLGRLFREFGKPVTKTRLEVNISNVGHAPLLVQDILNSTTYCVKYCWVDLLQQNLTLEVYVVKTDKGLYPVAGELYGPYYLGLTE